MKVNERKTVVGGVDWPLDWPSIYTTVGGGDTRVSPNRGERSTRMVALTTLTQPCERVI